ncbi:hypothetical protein ACFLYJ_02715 [Candidatus Cloacimonadota bacterium]
MKNRKWLLIIVAIVMIVNISFFFLIRLSVVDELVEKRVSKYIAENLNANVTFGNFTFNDKQLRITDLQISSSEVFTLNVQQIYIEYNLPQLVLSNFKSLRAIKHIKIFEPTLSYYLKPSQSEKKEKGKIPDISDFFKKLDVYNGTVSIIYNAEEINVEKELHDLNLSIRNNGKTQITMHCKGSKSDSVFAYVLLDHGRLKEAKLDLTDFDLGNQELPVVDDFSAVLNFSGIYKDKKLDYSGTLQNVEVTAYEKSGRIRSFDFKGDDNEVSCNFRSLVLDGNKLNLQAQITNIFTEQRKLSATLDADFLPLQKYVNQVEGTVNLEAKIKGPFDNLVITMDANSDSISSRGQTISDLELTGRMKNDQITFSLVNADWESNLITGSGSYRFGEELNIDLQSEQLIWQQDNLTIHGDLFGNISFKDIFSADLEIQNCEIFNPEFQLSELTLKANIHGKDFAANLQRQNEDLQISCRGFLDPQAIEAQIKLKRFDLRDFFDNSSLPIVSGNLDVTANEFSIVVNSVLRAYDQEFGKLNGRLSTNFVADLANERTTLNMRTFNGKFNYETFDLNLFAEGTLDSIRTKQFSINKNVNIDAWFRLKPDFQYGVNLEGDHVKMKDIAKYFMSYQAYSDLLGNADVQMHYDSRNNGLLNGSVAFENLKIGTLKEFNGQLIVAGTNDNISIYNSYMNCCEDRVLDLNGQIALTPELRIDASGQLVHAALENIFPDSKLKGNISGSFDYQQNPENMLLNAQFNAENIKNNDFEIDRINLRLSQKDDLLTIHEMLLEKGKLFKLDGNGSIGYNFLTNVIYPDSNTVDISFKGDLLKFLDKQSSSIKSGKSDCEFNLKFGMVETGLFIDDGDFTLKNGKLNIEGQPSELEKINLIFKIENDSLKLEKFDMKTGDGKLYIKNEITNSESDFMLGTLNLGKFKVKTNNAGLTLYIPKYTPKNSFLYAIISGRNTDYLEVTGPFDDLKIYGDILVFNGDLIYPPDTDNLMNLFNIKRTDKKNDTEAAPLPLSFDILLHVGENVRYVTFPIDVKVKEDGYLQLRYSDGEMQKPEGFFYSEEGSVDMFGTTLILDFMQVQLNQFGSGVSVSGIFYKKASDGTLITLEIYNDDKGDGSFGNLKFTLKSDDPTDKITDILAKLRYNRTMDEISPAQKKTLLQDEVIQIAGLGIESAVLDPLISPLENTLRQLFRLDYFHLQTDLIQNLFASYSSESKSEYTITEEQSQVDRFTSEMFLNNLSVSAGKYITRKLFFDYELRLEKEDQIITETYLGVYQNFKLRYDLPMKFKISYQFIILPFDEQNEHQIGLERSFKF